MTTAPPPDSTEDLISQLAGGLAPVNRLSPPTQRAALLVTLATLFIAALAAVRGLRADIDAKLADPSYLAAVIAAWLTGATATLAALEVSLPDRRRAWMWLPAPAAALWVWGVGFGCLAHWVTILEAKPVEESSVRCLVTLVSASIPLALALWVALGRAKPLRRNDTAWLAALAVAAFADTAHLLCHVVEATVFVLLMNLGLAAVIIAVLGALGGRVLARPG